MYMALKMDSEGGGLVLMKYAGGCVQTIPQLHHQKCFTCFHLNVLLDVSVRCFFVVVYVFKQ